MSLFDSHEDGCTPLMPCRKCRALSLLREKLSHGVINEFLSILGSETTPQLEPLPLDASVTNLELTPPLLKILTDAQITTIGSLLSHLKGKLSIPRLGEKSRPQVIEALAHAGHPLNTD